MLVTYSDNSTLVLSYDSADRLVAVVDSLAGTTTRTFDGLSRLTSETSPNGSVTYTYDDASRRTSMTIGGQPTITYGYDDANRLTEIIQGSTAVSFTYDGAGRQATQTLPNGVVVTYGYDGASRLASLAFTKGPSQIGTLTYEYDDVGRRVKTGGSLARTNLPPVIASAVYDSANRLTNWNGTTLTYDANGNLTNDGTATYVWNARDELVGMTAPGLSASFGYDPLGRRASRTVNGSTVSYWYDGNNVVQELSGGTASANLLVGFRPDQTFARSEAGGLLTLIVDGTNSTLALLDSAGATSTQYTYEPFGKATSFGTSSTSAFQFTGRENDGTGLYYYRARFYHPGLQRFISEDPLGYAGRDVNLQAYVGNSPTNSTDPTGTYALVLPIVVGGMVFLTIEACLASPACRKFLEEIIRDALAPPKPIPYNGGPGGPRRRGPERRCPEGGWPLEDHHLLPQEFEDFFESRGLNIEDYTIPLPRDKHRLKPDGIHTNGGGNWNRVWREWIAENPTASKEQILKQLEKMRRQFCI